MKKFLMLVGIFILLFGMYGVANAYVISYGSKIVGNEFYSPYDGVKTETFNNATLGGTPFSGRDQTAWTWSGNASVVKGSIDNVYSAPFGVTKKDESPYVTVPTAFNGSSPSVTVNLDGFYTYFGIWWGSMDGYNTLSFSNGESITGLGKLGPDGGDQFAAATNKYINFTGLVPFNSFTMSSSNFAFEADNIAVGNVPLPPSVWLLGSGLVGLVGLRRRFWKK